ncbi:MAG: SIR2 family protein [Promethearchaeota archaeon]
MYLNPNNSNSSIGKNSKVLPLEKTLPSIIKEGIVIFCGAGISIPPPSCSPSWWTLTEEILTAFFDRVPDSYNLPKDMILKDPEKQPEQVFEAFANILDTKFYKAFEALDVAKPNATHIALARLAKAGILKACFTTNFDIYLEHALRDENVDFVLLVDNIEYQNYFENNMKNAIPDNKFILCKVHGTIERPDTIVSVASAYKSAKGFSAPKAAVFEYLISKYPCLFLGYSGWDFTHLNYRRFWDRIGPKVKKIIWNRHPQEETEPDFKDIFDSCWNVFEFSVAELPDGLIKAIEQFENIRIFLADLTMQVYENVAAHFARAEVDRIRFFKNWVNGFPKSHMIGLVITESQKFSSTFREFMKKTQEISQDTEAASYNIGKEMQELGKRYSTGELSVEEYQQKIFDLSFENAMRLIRNEYKAGVRELFSQNKFPGLTDNSQNNLMFLNTLIGTTRYFELQEAASIAADYCYKMFELMKVYSDESRADQVILGFELQLKRPNTDDWKKYLTQMYEEKNKFLSGQIDFDKFQAICIDINQKATYELMGMTVDMFDLLDKQVAATVRSATNEEFEDQAGALCVTTLQIAPYLSSKYNKSRVYLDLIDAISQQNYPEEHRDASKVVTKQMLDEIDNLIRESFIPVLQKAESSSKLVKLLMEIAFISIWIHGVQYLDPVGMQKFQEIWEAGEYPRRFSPKQIFEYLKVKMAPWVDDALKNLPSRFAQKLCGNLAIMGEMGDDFELCKRTTLRSLELSEGVVTEATPENIPGNLAAFYERKGDKENALKYYQICLDAIKLTYPPIWADAIVYRSALILSDMGNKKGALEIIGKYHPNFRGNASSVVLPSRKMCLELAEHLAEELGYSDANTAIENILS